MYNDNNYWSLEPPMITINGEDFDFDDECDQDSQFVQID